MSASTSHPRPPGALDILTVCTGNMCRSPIMEALLLRRLYGAGVLAQVSSAGLMRAGDPVPATGVQLMARRGIDLSTHVSRVITTDQVTEADLVVVAAAEHVNAIVATYPEAFEKTYVLKDLVLRASHLPPGSYDLATWLATVGIGRTRSSVAPQDRSLDILDPLGRPEKVWRSVVDDIDAAVTRLAVMLGNVRRG